MNLTTRSGVLIAAYAILFASPWLSTTDDSSLKEAPVTHQQIKPFTVIGISVRTNNVKEAGPHGEIPKLWQRFIQEGLRERITNRRDSNIYALYTDYENNRRGEYTFAVGVMVPDEAAVPSGMVAKTVPGGQYVVFTSEAGPPAKVVSEAWMKAWKLEDQGKLSRAYKTDFELYEQRGQNPRNAQVDLYLGLR
jgi:predicted transcriptional regulator YdeE